MLPVGKKQGNLRQVTGDFIDLLTDYSVEVLVL
jgi:hypothetical protein